MVGSELMEFDAMAQADLVRRGQVSPLELVDAAIDRIEGLDPALNAVVTPLFDKARERAIAPDLPDGPFRGVPCLLKDFMCHSAGDPFYEGMAYLKRLNWVERDDTFLAAKFREAGLITIGKSNCCELGMTPDTQPEAFGPTRNPWDTERTPFGSSGGSAAAVAARMVAIGHANDGGGSIRLPASACGLVGLKPTNGRVSLGPEFGDVLGGFVAEHVVTRSVRDSAAVLDAIAGPEPGEPFLLAAPSRRFANEAGAEPGVLRIGLKVDHDQVAVDPECRSAVESVARLLGELGHEVEASSPTALDDPQLVKLFARQMCAGVAWILDHYWPRRTGEPVAEDDVEALTWTMAETGRSMSGGDFLAGREALQVIGRKIGNWYDAGGFDLLLTPTTPMLPPRIGKVASIRAAAFTLPFNVTGQPAISLPVGQSEAGLPIGVQFVAQTGREDMLIRLATQLEQALDWSTRVPPMAQ